MALSHLPRLFAALLLVLGLGACAGAIHQLPQISAADVNRATSEIESAEGLEATNRTVAENRAMVERVAAKLEKAAAAICVHVDSPTCHFDVRFDTSDTLDAYADGANRITITQGLAQYLETEAEFATVIAHEMGHHMNDHITKLKQNQMAGAIVTGILFGVLAGATGAYQYNPGGLQTDMNNMMEAGGAIGALSYSKEHEREADYIAAYIMARAGYDLNEGRALWAKLTKETGNYETEMFDTHPSGPDRLAAWDVTVAEVEASPDLLPNLLPQGTLAVSSGDRFAHAGTSRDNAQFATTTGDTSVTPWGIGVTFK